MLSYEEERSNVCSLDVSIKRFEIVSLIFCYLFSCPLPTGRPTFVYLRIRITGVGITRNGSVIAPWRFSVSILTLRGISPNLGLARETGGFSRVGNFEEVAGDYDESK